MNKYAIVGAVLFIYILSIVLYYIFVYGKACGNKYKHVEDIKKCSVVGIEPDFSDPNKPATFVTLDIRLGRPLPFMPINYNKGKLHLQLQSNTGFNDDYELSSRASHGTGWRIASPNAKTLDILMTKPRHVAKDKSSVYTWVIHPQLPSDTSVSHVKVKKN